MPTIAEAEMMVADPSSGFRTTRLVVLTVKPLTTLTELIGRLVTRLLVGTQLTLRKCG